MRIFVSHRLDDEDSHTEKAAAAAAPPPKPTGGKDFSALLHAAAAHHVLPQKKSTRKWTLVIEGGLLIQQLDHDSAKEVDRKWEAGLPLLGNVKEEAAEGDDSLRAKKYEMSAKNQFQTEIQELKTAKPLVFTHLFDKMEVEMKAVKESSNEDGSSTDASTTQVQTFTWNRDKSLTPDSHAFFVVYNEEGRVPLTDPNDKDSSEAPKAEYNSDFILTQIKLYRRQGTELYKPSDSLCQVLFPALDGKKPIPQSKKRKAQDVSNEQLSDIPKDVIIPNTMTMEEVLRAIFYYIRTRNLHDPADLSVINFDDALTELFGIHRMSLADLRRTLLEKGLLVRAGPGTHPIILNYKMTKEGSEPLKEEKPRATSAIESTKGEEQNTRTRSSNDACKEKADPAEKQAHFQTILCCDADIEIPNIYHLRTRDILRRINHREHEYTSCRNKAKNALAAMKIGEEAAKQAIDETITGSNLSSDLKQVWMALANGSHEGGEAQRAALIELRTISLMEKLEERTTKAREYWDVVEACRSLIDGGSQN